MEPDKKADTETGSRAHNPQAVLAPVRNGYFILR